MSLRIPDLFLSGSSAGRHVRTGTHRSDVCLTSIEVPSVCSVSSSALELSPHSTNTKSSIAAGGTHMPQRRLEDDFNSPSSVSSRNSRASLKKTETIVNTPISDCDQTPVEQGQYPLEDISFVGLLHLPGTKATNNKLQTSTALGSAAQKAIDKSVIKEADRLLLQMNYSGTQPVWLRWPDNMLGKQQWLRQMQRQHLGQIPVKHFVPVDNLKAWHEFNRQIDERRIVLVQSLARRYPLRKLYREIMEEQLVVNARHCKLREKRSVHRLNLRLDSLQRLKEEKRGMQWNPDFEAECCGSGLLQVAQNPKWPKLFSPSFDSDTHRDRDSS